MCNYNRAKMLLPKDIDTLMLEIQSVGAVSAILRAEKTRYILLYEHE